MGLCKPIICMCSRFMHVLVLGFYIWLCLRLACRDSSLCFIVICYPTWQLVVQYTVHFLVLFVNSCKKVTKHSAAKSTLPVLHGIYSALIMFWLTLWCLELKPSAHFDILFLCKVIFSLYNNSLLSDILLTFAFVHIYSWLFNIFSSSQVMHIMACLCVKQRI